MTVARPGRRGGQGGSEPPARIRTREVRAMELAIVGWTQQQIAADLGVSQAAVSKMLRRIDERVLRDLQNAVERHKVRQNQRLEHLYAEAMRAWTASKTDTTRRRQRRTHIGAGQAEATVAEIISENQHGDPRYLDEARKAMADLRKLWGLDAPQKIDVRAVRNRFDEMTEEDLRTELARQVQLLQAATPVAIVTEPRPLPCRDGDT
jgi:predicted transcriptional regulator